MEAIVSKWVMTRDIPHSTTIFDCMCFWSHATEWKGYPTDTKTIRYNFMVLQFTVFRMDRA